MFAVIAGGAMYYLQVYAFYDELPAQYEYNLTAFGAGPEPVAIDGFRGIDSDSSPIRYRACFEVTLSLATLTETYELLDTAEPLTAPRWFDCYDAEQIGADLESGAALAFLGTRDIEYGIDRIVAVYDDGRAFAWHQINHCGEVVFDGDPVPADCPEPPESYDNARSSD